MASRAGVDWNARCWNRLSPNFCSYVLLVKKKTMDHLLYQTHFGLREAPFNITPDPSFLYLSASHRRG